MSDLLRGIFESDFMPHGVCYQWKPEIVWLHAVSDGLIALAYYLIPVILIVFIAKRRDIAFGWMFVMFSAFIWLCGTTHLLNIYTIWNGTYGLSGSVKLVTGVVSMATAFALVPLVPKALALPSPAQLRDVNDRLRSEIDARRTAQEELRLLNEGLEARVAERSAELEETNARLRAEIEERRRTGDALRQSEARFRQLANSMPQLVWSADPDGTINYYNDRHRELDGIAPKESGAWSWDRVLHPEDADRTQAAWNAAVLTGTPYEIEHRARTREGAYRWMLSRGLPVRDDDGRIVQWYGSATDIDDQKAVEHRLREREAELEELSQSLERRVHARTVDLTAANQALRARNQDLQEFAYVASHDLKEPLRKVRTFAGMLSEEHAGQLSAEARHYLDRMQVAADRMTALINDLLSLSRVTTHGEPREPVDLAEIVPCVWQELTAGGDDARLVVDMDVPVISAEAVRIRQLIQNLLSNALKYRKPEEALVVTVTGRTQTRGGQAEVHLSFADNGIGFEQRHAERIFGAFQRLHGRGEYEGTGMGLAICRRIVDRHHGRIRATSEPGIGTRFDVEMPVGPVNASVS